MDEPLGDVEEVVDEGDLEVAVGAELAELSLHAVSISTSPSVSLFPASASSPSLSVVSTFNTGESAEESEEEEEEEEQGEGRSTSDE